MPTTRAVNIAIIGIEITKAIDALELLLPDGIRKSEQDQHKAQLLD